MFQPHQKGKDTFGNQTNKYKRTRQGKQTKDMWNEILEKNKERWIRMLRGI